MNLNRIIILGNVVADPENRMLPSGRPVTNFRVATNRVWNDEAGRRQEAVEFHRVVAFGRLAEIAAQYLAKGRLVLIEGRIQTRSWDAPDGSKRYQTEIVTEGLQLGPRMPGAPDSGREDADISGRNVSRRGNEATEDAPARRGGADDRREDAPAQRGGADDRREDAPTKNEPAPAVVAAAASAPLTPPPPPQTPEENIPVVDLDAEDNETQQKIRPEDLPF